MWIQFNFYFARIALSKFLSCMHFFHPLTRFHSLSHTHSLFALKLYHKSVLFFLYSKLCFSYFFSLYTLHWCSSIAGWNLFFFVLSHIYILVYQLLALVLRLLIFMTPEDRSDYSETCVSAYIHWLQVHSKYFELCQNNAAKLSIFHRSSLIFFLFEHLHYSVTQS